MGTYPPAPVVTLNENAARYAVVHHYLGLVDADE